MNRDTEQVALALIATQAPTMRVVSEPFREWLGHVIKNPDYTTPLDPAISDAIDRLDALAPDAFRGARALGDTAIAVSRLANAVIGTRAGYWPVEELRQSIVVYVGQLIDAALRAGEELALA